MSEWAGRRVLVVGLGLSGHAAAKALSDLDAKVTVLDEAETPAIEARAQALRDKGVEVQLGPHDLEAVDADLVVISPGIPPSAPVVRAVKASGVPTIGEVELAYRLARCDFLAVTGTNGKTTTTTLLAAMLEAGGITTAAAGNIGLPLVEAVATVPPGGAIAVEVSSFQLAAIERFRPTVGLLLNVAEDHTDWHGSFDSYVSAKARLVENQGPQDTFVFNANDEHAVAIAAGARSQKLPFSAVDAPEDGIGIRGDEVVYRGRSLMRRDAISLLGLSGLEDSIAAAGTALAYGVNDEAVTGVIETFEALPHRLSEIATHAGIAYVDDSKATNPHATLSAVKGLENVSLIAGGRSKGIDLSPLRKTVPPVVAVSALGEATEEVARVFEGLVPVAKVESMCEAVDSARSNLSGRGTVLLSPGCASLDMYSSYVARGEDFARCVRLLIEREDKA